MDRLGRVEVLRPSTPCSPPEEDLGFVEGVAGPPVGVPGPVEGLVGLGLLGREDALGHGRLTGEAPVVLAGGENPSAGLEVFEGAGHFIWKDAPDRYWEIVRGFVAAAGASEPAGVPG